MHTKFPASAPPVAPERATTSRLLLRGYIILILIAALGHSAVVHLAGLTGAMIALLALTLANLAIWIPEIVRARPAPFAWRRLPWAALVYAALAGLSVLWSAWPTATVLTWTLLAFLTAGALFVAHSLTWRESLRAIASALKWLLGLSLAIELWTALVLRHPLAPLVPGPQGAVWVEGNLFEAGRIQGIVGHANLLAPLCLLALIVFGLLFAARVRWRATLVLWILIAAFLLYRSGSRTMFAATAIVALVLAIALLMRRARDSRARRWLYLGSLGTAAIAITLMLLNRESLLALVDRDVNLEGRTPVWESVLSLAGAHPALGLGYSAPWVPGSPLIDGLIAEHGMTVFQAHSVWVDVRFQLGWVGLALLAAVYLTLFWRAWFFAVDRPRWDLDAARPYSPLTLAPLLITVSLLVQSVTDSSPMMMWGWMLAVLFNFKLRAVPLLGVGLSEAERTIERGRVLRAVP